MTNTIESINEIDNFYNELCEAEQNNYNTGDPMNSHTDPTASIEKFLTVIDIEITRLKNVIIDFKLAENKILTLKFLKYFLREKFYTINENHLKDKTLKSLINAWLDLTSVINKTKTNRAVLNDPRIFSTEKDGSAVMKAIDDWLNQYGNIPIDLPPPIEFKRPWDNQVLFVRKPNCNKKYSQHPLSTIQGQFDCSSYFAALTHNKDFFQNGIFTVFDVVIHILKFLKPKHLRNLSLTSRFFCNLIQENPDLKKIYYEDNYTLTFFLKEKDKDPITLLAKDNHFIEDLKQAVKNKGDYSFFYKGKSLAGGHKPSSYDISTNAIIEIVPMN